MADRRIRIGFAGGGLRGSLFAQLAARHPDVEIVGVHDPSTSSARSFVTARGGREFGDLEALLDEALDALVVATPDHLHTASVLAGARRGIPMLVEKPLATSTVDAVAMRDAVLSSGADVSVAYLNRWHPAFRSVLAEAEAGTLGRILFQNARLSNSVKVPTQALSWASASSPGWFLMPHTLDIVAKLAPVGPTTVRATGHRGVLAARGVDTWDGLQALLTFEDGSSASVESLWVLPEGMPVGVRFGFEVVGEDGTAVVDDSRQGLEYYRASTTEYPRALVAGYDDIPMGPNTAMVDAFLQSLRDGLRRLPGIDEAVWVVQLIEAIHAAADSGGAVVVEPVSARTGGR